MSTISSARGVAAARAGRRPPSGSPACRSRTGARGGGGTHPVAARAPAPRERLHRPDLQPSACTASRQHARTATPSSCTVHAPQTPCSQPTCVPVSPSGGGGSRSAAAAARPRSRIRAVDRERDLVTPAPRRAERPLDERPRDLRGGTPARHGSCPAGRRRAASAPASRADASSPRRPRRRSRRSITVGRSVTAPTATRTSRDPPPAQHDRDHREREVAGAQGELLEGAALARPRRGQTVSTTSSPGSSVGQVVRDEEVLRRDLAPPARARATTVPPSAARQSGISAAPSAWAIEPPTVPRLRVTKWPTYGSACREQRVGSAVAPERGLARRSRRSGRCRSLRSRRARRG